MKAPWNRQHELYWIKPKNKSFDLNFDLFMVKLWSNFGQNRSFQQIYHNLSFIRARRVNESSLKSSSWAEFIKTKKKSRFEHFFGENDLFLTLIWPYFDPKMAITIVWTELFGPMRAPRNRHHELYSNKQNKNNFFHFFQILWSNNPFFDQNLTIIWP